MKLYINGTPHEVKGVHQRIGGKTVELHEGTLQYYSAVMLGILRGVVSFKEAAG